MPNSYEYPYDVIFKSNSAKNIDDARKLINEAFDMRCLFVGVLVVDELGKLKDSVYEKDLSDIFKKERYESAVAFFEFFGKASAFGQHLDEPHEVVMFDVAPYKHGIMEPRQFIKTFGSLKIPEVLYEGKANSFLIEAVRNSTLDGMVEEGVVCKGRNDKKTKTPIMFKIKSNAWLNKLRTHCNGDDRLFNELA